ncbi:MAG: hypothetical protein HUU46_19495 [Candidatus Hydrogenedentes bacterium]|nr:hypothetical protein [Candidatus Hydrogenedentota bacterium]
MTHQGLDRRTFLHATALSAVGALAGGALPAERRPVRSGLTLNDDGNVFIYMNDDLHAADLRRYFESYCRPGVNAVAFCVGDMSWPTLYPTKVGVHYSAVSPGGDLKRVRAHRNVDNFSSEPGGFIGTALRILRELGKTTLASFRMNDAHFTTPDNPDVSEFWKQHAQHALGPAYGYYGGCLDYASDVVRDHFYRRVVEFMELFPDVDGLELDAMRSPYFFAPDKGKEHAPLFTELVRTIKAALAEQAKRLNRADYLLTVNVPLTPELCLESGLDAAAWDAERLFDCISVGTYQVYMNAAIERWQTLLVNGTPVFAYVNCSPQTGRYLGLEEYRAAAANAYGAGADGVYLFNYPCLFELAMQVASNAKEVPMTLPDLRHYGQLDFSTVAQALDEIGNPDALKGKDKHYLFGFSGDTGYRHFAPTIPAIERGAEGATLKADFRCYEDLSAARAITLRFKVDNVTRTDAFTIALNGGAIDAGAISLRFAGSGRDTRMHTVTLAPFLEFEIALRADHIARGENSLVVAPAKLNSEIAGKMNLTEIELDVRY